jgi:hypothetical protein
MAVKAHSRAVRDLTFAVCSRKCGADDDDDNDNNNNGGEELTDYSSIPGGAGIPVLAIPHKMGSTQPPIQWEPTTQLFLTPILKTHEARHPFSQNPSRHGAVAT